MSLADLMTLEVGNEISNRQWSLRDGAIKHYETGVRAATTGENEIDIYGVIGEDFWEQSVSLSDVDAALKAVSGDVVVNINSPGGDFFAGVGIYNLLAQHDGKVTTRIVGLAASAASVIAMAGDEIEIAETGFMMIHKAWGLTVGNADDNRKAAETLDRFDASMSRLYASRMGEEPDTVLAMMADDTWFDGPEAIEAGLATAFLKVETTSANTQDKLQARADLMIENAMRASYPNMSRSERRALRKDMKAGMQTATGTITQNADVETVRLLSDLAKAIRP